MLPSGRPSRPAQPSIDARHPCGRPDPSPPPPGPTTWPRPGRLPPTAGCHGGRQAARHPLALPSPDRPRLGDAAEADSTNASIAWGRRQCDGCLAANAMLARAAVRADSRRQRKQPRWCMQQHRPPRREQWARRTGGDQSCPAPVCVCAYNRSKHKKEQRWVPTHGFQGCELSGAVSAILPQLGHAVPVAAPAVIINAGLACSALLLVQLARPHQALHGVRAGPAAGRTRRGRVALGGRNEMHAPPRVASGCQECTESGPPQDAAPFSAPPIL